MPFSTLTEASYIGRNGDLAALAALAGGPRRPRSTLLCGPAGVGKSELLRQLYTMLFWKQAAVVPFSYRVSPAAAADLGRDYLVRFLCQWFAFTRRDQSLLPAGRDLDELLPLAAARGETWVVELIGRFRASTRPLDQLRMALQAPRAAAAADGRPVLVMIDDLPLLAEQRRDGPPVAALLAEQLDDRRTPHLLAGLPEALDSLPVPVLPRHTVEPLALADADLLVRSLLRERGIVSAPVPSQLLLRLGGIPRYLRFLADAVAADRSEREDAYEAAYRREIGGGMICRTWQAALERAIEDPAERLPALRLLRALLAPQQGGRTVWPFADLQAAFPDVRRETVTALCRAGALRCGFGAVRTPDDRVLADVVARLHEQDALDRDAAVPGLSLEDPSPAAEGGFTVSLLLPRERNAELIAALCLEQVGKNRDVPADAIGQLQIALIEACVNAIEHGQGRQPVPVRITVERDSITAAVRSPGKDFTLDATGEPVSVPLPGTEPRRGWGVTLMKRFCSDVRFERSARGTTVVLRRTWTPEPRQYAKEESTHD